MASGGHHGGGKHSGGYMGMQFLFIGIILFEQFLDQIPFYQIIMFVIFFFAFILFIPGMKEKNRFAAISEIRKKSVTYSRGSVWSANYTEKREGDEYTWYGKYDKNYSISFFDEEYGRANLMIVKETVRRTPGIIWVKTSTWLVCAIVCAVCNLFFYKLVITVFERSDMTDSAFGLIDFLSYFLPAFLALVFGIFSIIFVRIRDSLLYRCAVRAVADNRAQEKRTRIERNIDRKLSNKWYYNNCPNCGANASFFLRNCSHCGTSLEVRSFEGGAAGAIHRLIKTGDDGEES